MRDLCVKDVKDLLVKELCVNYAFAGVKAQIFLNNLPISKQFIFISEDSYIENVPAVSGPCTYERRQQGRANGHLAFTMALAGKYSEVWRLPSM